MPSKKQSTLSFLNMVLLLPFALVSADATFASDSKDISQLIGETCGRYSSDFTGGTTLYKFVINESRFIVFELNLPIAGITEGDDDWVKNKDYYVSFDSGRFSNTGEKYVIAKALGDDMNENMPIYRLVAGKNSNHKQMYALRAEIDEVVPCSSLD